MPCSGWNSALNPKAGDGVTGAPLPLWVFPGLRSGFESEAQPPIARVVSRIAVSSALMVCSLNATGRRTDLIMTEKNARNELRIIGGAWRGRRLRFPAVDAIRPTPDRVRET